MEGLLQEGREPGMPLQGRWLGQVAAAEQLFPDDQGVPGQRGMVLLSDTPAQG